MPELPEVETVARTLAPQICGRCIVGIDVMNAGTWQGRTSAAHVEAEHFTVVGTGRRGKLLLLYLSHEKPAEGNVPAERDIPVPESSRCWPLFYTAEGIRSGRPGRCGKEQEEVTALAFHLRMTGRLFVYPQEEVPTRHTRIVFTLDDGRKMFFDDARKFGQARALCSLEMEQWQFWRTLGPEPLEISEEKFVACFSSGASIKSLLLKQSVIAGIGNIYADESLFRAGIRPDAAGNTLAASRLARLHRELVGILMESMKECGSSIRDYRTARGDAGAFQNHFLVYGRAGEKCAVCGRKLASLKVAGRTTVWCPHCQKR